MRNSWQFQYLASEVAKAARERATYHKSREVDWAHEVEQVKDDIEAAGIDIRSYDITGGQRHEIIIDASLSNRLSEAQTKVAAHKRDYEHFDMYARVLGANGDAKLTLDVDDIEHFKIHA